MTSFILDPQGPVWWWKLLWKLRAPKKTQVFMWLALKNKVLTWEALQKRGRQGPHICMLCRSAGEDILQLLIQCPFTQQLWKEAEMITGIQNVGAFGWRGTLLFFKGNLFLLFKSLLGLVLWFLRSE